jgi:hypothetical protein
VACCGNEDTFGVGHYDIMMKYFRRFETLISVTPYDKDFYEKHDREWAKEWCDKLYPLNHSAGIRHMADTVSSLFMSDACIKEIDEDVDDIMFKWIAESFLVRYLAVHAARLVEDQQIRLILPRVR